MGILGIGTGRCGSTSLSMILHLTHENPRFRAPWLVPQANMELVKELRIGGGDVAAYHLPHIPLLQKMDPKLKVVCLKRPRPEFIRSLAKWWRGKNWFRAPRTGWRRYFPYIDAPLDEAAGRYWDTYYEMVSNLDVPIFHLATEELNDDIRLLELFAWLDIHPSLPTRRIWNQGPV